MSDSINIHDLAAQRQAELLIIEQAKERIDVIDAQLLALTRVGDKLTDPNGNVLFKVRAGQTRFNAALAAEVLTPEQLAAISEPTPKSALAKEALPGALYAMCCKTGDPSIAAVSS